MTVQANLAVPFGPLLDCGVWLVGIVTGDATQRLRFGIAPTLIHLFDVPDDAKLIGAVCQHDIRW